MIIKRTVESAEASISRLRRMFENAHHLMGSGFLLDMDDIHVIAN
jgi:hypothetical protein